MYLWFIPNRLDIRGSKPQSVILAMVCSPLVMVYTPGGSINEKNRQASGGLFLFPFSWAHLPYTDQTTVTLIYLGPVGESLCEITPDGD